MKQIVFSIVIAVMSILLIISCIFLWNRYSKQNELETAVDCAMVMTMRGVEKGKGEIISEKKMQDRFISHLKKQLNKGNNGSKKRNLDVEIRFLESNPKMGVLSCEVKENFTYPSGKTGQLEYKRTILRERKKTVEILEVKLDGYKSYMVEKGKDFNPGDVIINGKKVRRWLNKNEQEIKFPVVVTEDMVLEPVV